MRRRDQSSPARSGPEILWGRVAFYGLSLLLAFALGAWSASDDSAEADLEEARSQINRLTEENVNLRAEKEALEAGEALEAQEASGAAEGEAPESDSEGGSEETSDGSSGAEEDGIARSEASSEPSNGGSEANTYVVHEGDTGLSIAADVYGDPELWPLIAEANDLGSDNVLRVDQELVIPPAD